MRRRGFLIGGGALIAARGLGRDVPSLRGRIAALEAETGGRIGLAILDTGNGARFAYRGGERFPLCSTFKLPLAAAVLRRVDLGLERLDRGVAVTAADILGNSPFSATRVGGEATVAELCEAAMTRSDNAAANLLLSTIGGPPALTRFVRSLGDSMTRLDRIEPDLNEATPGDPRDTTTPSAMVELVRRLSLVRPKTPSSTLLADWMLASQTGVHRMRAGLPPDWRIGDKTGAGAHGSDNEVAILWPPGAPPLLVASYLTGSDRPLAETNAVHARLGRLISAA